MASKNDYFGLEYIISLILAIIPFTSWILGIVTRIMEGKLLPGILRIIPPIAFVAWIGDIICMVTKKSIWRAL